MALIGGKSSTDGAVADAGITNKSIHVKLPEHSYGLVSVGETTGSNTVATSTYTYSNGINGASITNVAGALSTGETDDTNIYVAFNNHAMSDPTLAGFRYVVGPGQSMSVAFEGTPKPTQMYIRIDAAEVLAFHAVAESA